MPHPIRTAVTLTLAATLTALLPAAATTAATASAAGPIEASGAAKKAAAEHAERAPKVTRGTFSALRARMLGPAVNSGRISDIAVNPTNFSEFYVTAASGGVWKTTDGGVTFDPIFDSQASYSIGCVTIDPANPHVVWVGTGENNAQRSVSWGDGVYKSEDGGRTWTNMGLRESKHIGMIVVHPDDSDTVFVAAQGPLWNSGGDRGLYKTTDGGATWERILHIDEDTGANEIHLDPRDPDVMYCSTYQRRRHVWTMINGGPGSGIHKSTDGGKTWTKLTRGLPGGDMGKIGMDIAPANPDVIYAIVEAKDGRGGTFRSINRGASWQRMNSAVSSAPMYYHELVCDPYDVDRVWQMDTFLQLTEDGGRTWQNRHRRNVHVDYHALWINPNDTRHMIAGNDGGVYITYDGGGTYRFVENLPITQFYRVTADNDTPFYNIYGGTQDNNTLGGPTRTNRREGITNEDWFVTVGGDGFETQVDPVDPNLVYSQWQYGGLVRYDKRTGETVDIKPRPAPGEEPHVFNWDAPLLISPHDRTRLYFGGRRLYRTDDRGDSWTAISGDLSRGIDRNDLEVMGKVWPVDAVAKHRSTSIFGNIVSLSESPLVEDLLYVGTDDGLIHVTSDGGANWERLDSFPGVPHMTYVSCVMASRHDADTVYASFDNHKQGDYTPYVIVSRDRGRSWRSIAGDLPGREVVYSIAEDHVRPGLVFLGTEFGAYFTLHADADPKPGAMAAEVPWTRFSGLPTIAVQDVDIQRRENDLLFATFGRGFYVIDDYSPMQHVTNGDMDADAHVFPIKDALFYIPGSKGRGSQGAGMFRAPNPPFGAMITWHLKDSVRNGPRMDSNATSPEYDKIREQERTRTPAVWLTIRDAEGETVARIAGPRSSGIHRTMWDLRYSGSGWGGPYVLPGTYTVSISKQVDGDVTELLEEPVSFEVVHLDAGTIVPTADEKVAIRDFHRQVVELSRAVSAASSTMSEIDGRLSAVENAVFGTLEASNDDMGLAHAAHELRNQIRDARLMLTGDSLPARFQEPTLPGIQSRIGWASASWRMTAPPTQTQRDAHAYAEAEFAEFMDALEGIQSAWDDLREQLDDAGIAWTPGRAVRWDG